MYKLPNYESTTIEINEATEGEPLERKLERIIHNGENTDEGAPSIFTDRKDGVLPAYDIRADKWDIALDAMNGIHNQDKQRRQSSIEERKKALEEKNEADKGLNEGENSGVESGNPSL